jgi:eukaryotic-like serine/threonine-protein kinase
MKSFFRFAMLALVLVIVAMVSGLTAMRLAIHGQEVTVPAIVGLAPADAERAAAALGLQMTIERQYYSPQIPEGRIMSQLPLPGTKVRRGWQVRAAQSLGRTRVTIPDVAGQSEHAAELNIRRRGLDIASMAQVESSQIPPDQVLAQSPPANAEQLLEPKISLLITSAAEPQTFVMPSFAGQLLGSASRTLQDSGFKLGSVTVASPVAQPTDAANANSVNGAAVNAPTATSGGNNSGASNQVSPAVSVPAPTNPPQPSPSSVIVSQVPAAGQKVSAGAAVSFEVR